MRTYKTISCSVTGYRKKRENIPCEDATTVLRASRGTIVAVADGHGDKRCLFASVGARLAVRAACNVLKLYLSKVAGNASIYWNSLRQEIAIDIAKAFADSAVEDFKARCSERITQQEVSELKRHIREYFKGSDDALTPTELREKYINNKKWNDKLGSILFLYGTTVRASVLTDCYIFSCALGDGDSVAVINDRIEWLLPKSEAFECETASLCEPFEFVIDSFLFSFVECKKESPQGKGRVKDTGMFVPTVLLATDGLRNSFLSDSLFEKKMLEISRAAHLNSREAKPSRLRLLYEKLSRESAYQDDISTVIAIRAENE